MNAEPRATSDGVPTPAVPRIVALAIRSRHQEAALEWYVRSVLSGRRHRSSDPPPASTTQRAAESPPSPDGPVPPPQ